MKKLNKMMVGLKKKEKKEIPKNIPPFFDTVASFQDRIRAYKTALVVVSIVFAVYAFRTESRLDQKDNELRQKKTTIVAIGTSNTALGSISEQVIRRTFDSALQYLNTFTFDTVDESYSYLERFMTADLRARFRHYWRSEASKWKEDRYEQVAHLKPTSHFYSENGDSYTTIVKFKTSRWMGGRAISDEFRYLKMTLKRREYPKPDTNSILDISDYKWLKETEYIDEKEDFDTRVAAL